MWKEGGITEGREYAILTNEIYKEWSGMNTREYKEFKGLRDANINVAKRGGSVAYDARKSYEKATKQMAIIKKNPLNYQYIDDVKKIENK